MDQFGRSWLLTRDLLCVLDYEGNYEAANPAFHRVLGRTEEELVGRSFLDFIAPENLEHNVEALRCGQQDDPLLDFVNTQVHKDGTYRYISWNAMKEDDKFFCTGHDVTDAINNASTLKSWAEEAKLREQFIAVLGHDLRNPLAAISSASRMLRRQVDDERSELILNGIDNSVVRMSELITSVMDFAQARLGGGFHLGQTKPVNIRSVIQQTVDEIKITNPTVRIEIKVDCGGDVDCDGARIAQMVSNLLGNAVTYGDPSHPIEVCAQDRNENGEFVLTIGNHGDPIPDDTRRRLFEPFYRADVSSTKKGLGLGLFISSEIARAHGGSLNVSSEGRVTRFTFNMPRRTSGV